MIRATSIVFSSPKIAQLVDISVGRFYWTVKIASIELFLFDSGHDYGRKFELWFWKIVRLYLWNNLKEVKREIWVLRRSSIETFGYFRLEVNLENRAHTINLKFWRTFLDDTSMGYFTCTLSFLFVVLRPYYPSLTEDHGRRNKEPIATRQSEVSKIPQTSSACKFVFTCF